MIIQSKEGLVPRFNGLEDRELHALSCELGLRGFVHVVLRNGDDEISHESMHSNGITQIGDEYYGERASGITSPPDQVTGMRLGTGTTAFADTGAGAAIVTHITGSNVAIDGTYPQSSLSSNLRRITWKSTWAAGTATNSAIAEAVITNLNPIGTGAGSAADTISRVVLSPVVNKGASDTLELTWHHDLGTVSA
jgi:hypothetical protein